MVSKKKIYKITAGILIFAMAITLIPLSAAFGESGFRPGNIISDANMYQSSPSMTQAEIQKIPSDTRSKLQREWLPKEFAL